MSYRIKTVAAMTGIPRATIVAWERRYNVLEPRRSPAGYRIYDDSDVAFLRQLKAKVDEGLAISEAVALYRGGGFRDAPVEEPAARAPTTLHGPVLDALLAFDRTAAERALVPLRETSFERQLDHVYMPTLEELGDMWEAGAVTIAQEHYASGFVRERMLGMFQSLDAGPVDGPTVTCAAPPGETHELGLLAVAIRLALRGFRITWLGSDLPFPDLCAFLGRHPPRLVALSAIRRGSERAIESYARQVRACAHPRSIVCVGGPGVIGLEERSTERLWFCPSLEALLARWNQESRGT